MEHLHWKLTLVGAGFSQVSQAVATTHPSRVLHIAGPRKSITKLIRDLSLSSIGSPTTLGGWLTSRRQANASLAFFTLKDTYSSIQLVVSEPKLIKRLMEMPLESVIQIEGMVKPRLKKATKKSSLDVADELEIGVDKAILLNPADKVLPFYPNHPELVSTEPQPRVEKVRHSLLGLLTIK
jgi:aspartyl-tRNA synthetase